MLKKSIAQLLVCLFVCLLAFGCQEKKEATTVEAFKELLISLDEVQLVDVRTPEEFEEGTIEGAKLVNFKQDDFMEQMNKLDKSKPVMVFCRSGNRSGKAAKMLKEAGFEQVYDLEGGYKAWKASDVDEEAAKAPVN
ncbi:rhodanese-like domain-containing protein [Limibacter armeniacum]|uniref:rhodanese-like domain-containing protein n=1 Tax=Limibacter armeniacum TaxID=466084 RepID=UPI002FE5F94F